MSIRRFRHGASNGPLYRIWSTLKYRRGKGVRVDPRWAADFIHFRAWSLFTGYQPGLTLERLDKSGA